MVGAECIDRQSSQPNNGVDLEIDIEWESFDEYNRPRTSGFPVHTKTSIVSQSAIDSNNKRVGDLEWYWDRTVNGISRNEERPMRATVTMTIVGNHARAGSTTTHQLALNPQIVVQTQGVGATEGTDTHISVPVILVPPALETLTVDYATNDTAGSATAGTDFHLDVGDAHVRCRREPTNH